MAGSLFITGGSGFIGRRLLSRLDLRDYEHVFCLSRRPSAEIASLAETNLTWMQGSLLDSSSYAHSLDDNTTVVHMAAMTGKAPAENHFAVNRDATQHLLRLCRERQVRRFLHMSSIAVSFRDTSNYSYAQSKLESEELVRKSGLNFVIIRPTIVLGRESPAWQSLSQLARLPWVPVFGDGSAKIQPIDVDDLVDSMVTLIGEKEFRGDTYEIGGPDVLTMEEFLRKVHRLYCANEARVWHVPYQPVKALLACAEKFAFSWMPISAGQLSAFVQDSIVTDSPFYTQQRPRMKDLDTVLRQLAQ